MYVTGDALNLTKCGVGDAVTAEEGVTTTRWEASGRGAISTAFMGGGAALTGGGANLGGEGRPTEKQLNL